MNPWFKAIEDRSKLSPNQITFKSSELSVSAADLFETIKRVSVTIKSCGLKPQDRALVICKDSIPTALSIVGLLSHNLVGLVLSPRTPRQQLLQLFRKFNAACVLSDCTDHSEIKSLITYLIEQEILNSVPFDLTNSSLKLFSGKAAKIDYSPPQNLGWALLTSGSTGDAKIVMISKNDLLARAFGEIRDFELKSDNRILNALPFSHDLGLNQILTTLIGNLELTISQTPFVANLAGTLKSGNFHGLTGTPYLWVDLLRQNLEGAHLKYLTISGGGLSAKKYSELLSRLPKARIIRTYGQTETFRTLLSDAREPDSFSKAISGTKFRIFKEQGHTGESGELLHSGDGTMLGYFGDPKLSNEKFTSQEGSEEIWIRTGDYFTGGADGLIRFSGRKDFLIKRYEQRFSLKEVETAIENLPGVYDVVISTEKTDEGNPKGYRLWAFVIREPHHKIDQTEILDHCKNSLMYWAWPDGVSFLNEFPRTSSGKIDLVGLSAKIPSENSAREL